MQAKSRTLTRNDKSAYLFILPFFLVYISFQLFPQVFSFYLSLTNFKIRGTTAFVGLRNFVNAWNDKLFWQGLRTTAFFWLTTLPVQMLGGFILAMLMINLGSRLRGMLSGFMYLPVVTNLIAVIFVFRLLFDQNYGVLNYVLQSLGMNGVPWLISPVWARISTVLLILWKGMGYYVVYMLAGMMNVDRALYEYAQLEGANAVQKAWHITVPAIAPILLYQAFTGTIAGWNIFLEPYMLFARGGGPLNSCMTVAIYIYNEGFQNVKFSYGAAMSLMVAVITTAFASLQFRLFNAKSMQR